MRQYDKKTIMPFVVLYKGVFDNAPDILKMLKESEPSNILQEWEPWYELGDRTRLEPFRGGELSDVEKHQLEIQEYIYDNLISAYKDYVEDWTKPEIIEKYVNPNRSFHEDWKYVFGDFVDDWSGFDDLGRRASQKETDCWIRGAVEILKHDHTLDSNLELAIGYHLDAFNSKDAAGPKSIITGTVYLNDDYEGGEISFLNEFDDTIISYKPKQGDLIVFPSAKPFFHAAQTIKGADKYLIRNFLLWQHSGSERYKEGEQKFGKEQWALMQDYIRETEDLLGFYQKDVYLPGTSVYDRKHGNGIPFFPKSVSTWEDN
jgi:hypothetical protein